jgi:hypothetical protein
MRLMDIDVEKGVKAGIASGIVNGIVFSIIYMILGIKEFPIAIMSFGYFIMSIIFYVFNGAIFGLIYDFLYDYVPIKSNIKKGLILSILGWFLLRFIPFQSLMLEKPSIIVESLVSFIFLGVVVGMFWNYFSHRKFN